jgi:hypothetical protein
MKMARTVTLVLLGGGVVIAGATMLASGPSRSDRQRACTEARAQNRPDAEQICANAASSTRTGGGSWWYGRSGGGTSSRGPALAGGSGFRADTSGTSARGGFGSTSRGFTSSGG